MATLAGTGVAPAADAGRSLGGAGAAIRAIDMAPPPGPALGFNEMAQAMGLFAKHGLVYAGGPGLDGGGPARVQEVATGLAEVATSDIISAFGAIHAGADLRVLMVMTPHGDAEVWGRSRINTLQDAVGQTWAVASLAGAQRFNAQLVAAGLGLKPDGFRFVPIAGGDGERLAALANGRAALATISHLGAVLAAVKGYAKQMHALVPHTDKYTAQLPQRVVVAKESWIKGHQDEATRYVETMLDAGRQWHDNAASWIEPQARAYADAGINRQQLATTWQLLRDGGSFTLNGGVSYAATQRLLELFFKLHNESPNQYLSKASDVYDTGPLAAALDRMGLFKGAAALPDRPDWYRGAAAH